MQTHSNLAIEQYPYTSANLAIDDKINCKILYININLACSVLDLKKEIEIEYDDLSASNMRLVFSGHLLNDFFSLFFQGIQNGSTIYLIREKVDKFYNDPILNETFDIYESSSLSKIHVLYLTPYISSIKVIKTNLSCSISRLNSVFYTNSIYIFNGEVLDINKPFSFYRISEGDALVCIPKLSSNDDSVLIGKWIKRTNDSESFQKFIVSNTKKNSQNENAKRADIRYSKIELNQKRYFKTFNENRIEVTYLPTFSKDDEIKLNIDYQKPSLPSTSKLPKFVRKNNNDY